MNTKIATILAIAFTAPISHGEKEPVKEPVAEAVPIAGAFGYLLGDTFDPKTAIKVVEHDSIAENQYHLPKSEPPTPFSEVFVKICPTTKRIYSIVARMPNDLLEERAALEKTLQEKYGTDKQDPLPEGYESEKPLISRGGRLIVVSRYIKSEAQFDKFIGNIPRQYALELGYMDFHLLKEAWKEQGEIKKAKAAEDFKKSDL